jgi:hypothetical protein
VTDKPVTSVALHSNVICAVIDGELKRVQGAHLSDFSGAPKGIRRLRILAGDIWALTDQGVYRFAGNWEQVGTDHLVDLCMHLGKIYGASQNALFRFENGHFVNLRPEGGYLSTDSTLVMEDFTQVNRYRGLGRFALKGNARHGCDWQQAMHRDG